MKRVLRQSMKEMLVKYLLEFTKEPQKDISTIEHYAEKFVSDYERYLVAYNEFKED